MPGFGPDWLEGPWNAARRICIEKKCNPLGANRVYILKTAERRKREAGWERGIGSAGVGGRKRRKESNPMESVWNPYGIPMESLWSNT